jgi:hypothetical protein
MATMFKPFRAKKLRARLFRQCERNLGGMTVLSSSADGKLANGLSSRNNYDYE